MFENLETRQKPEAHAVRPSAPSPARKWPVGIIVSSMIILSIAGFVAYDLSAVFFFKSFQAEAMSVVKPDMRLTEAERALNAAGYQTRYSETATFDPTVEVSLMKHESLLLKAVQKLAKPSTAREFRSWISRKSSFALAQHADGLKMVAANGL